MNAPTSSVPSTIAQPFDGGKVRAILRLGANADDKQIESRLLDAAIALAESESPEPTEPPVDGVKLREIFHLPSNATDEEVEAKLRDAAAALGKKERAPVKTPWDGIPPAPMHDPRALYGPQNVEARVAAGNKLIEEIKKEGVFTDYTTAHNEAQRRAPDLFK